MITMVRVSQRAVTCAWSWQTAAPQSARMATASTWSRSAAQSKQFMARAPRGIEAAAGPQREVDQRDHDGHLDERPDDAGEGLPAGHPNTPIATAIASSLLD
jgi:hypothetical protein